MRPRLSARALADLDEMIRYVSDRNPNAAERIRLEISDAIEQLRDFPEIGSRRIDLTRKDFRFFTVAAKYTLAYTYRERVHILRVLGPGRDIKRALRGMKPH